MRKIKTQRGITLIALIITIVVLLILAAVAVNSIQDGGILGHASNAADTYKEGERKEGSILGNLIAYIKANTPHEHVYNEQGLCTICSKECSHEYENGACKFCSDPCPHEERNESCKCTTCGGPSHNWNEYYDTCLDCGFECYHDMDYNNTEFIQLR